MGYMNIQPKEFTAQAATEGNYKPEKIVQLYGDVMEAVKNFQGSLDEFVAAFGKVNSHLHSSEWTQTAQDIAIKTDDTRELLYSIITDLTKDVKQVNDDVAAKDASLRDLVEQNKTAIDNINGQFKDFGTRRYS